MKVTAIKTIQHHTPEDFDARCNQLIREGWQPDGPMIVKERSNYAYFYRSFVLYHKEEPNPSLNGSGKNKESLYQMPDKRTCVFCGNEFKPKRVDSTCCSIKCSVRASQNRIRAKRKIERLEDEKHRG